MKIDETPFALKTTSPLDKLRRPHPLVEGALDDLDLTFLDLLESVSTRETEKAAEPAPVTSGKTTARKKTASREPETESKSKLAFIHPERISNGAEPDASLEAELELLNTELTEGDIQYLKQAVIPGLPILMGTVPVQNVFPAGEDGQISYRGFEVSPKLSELIEKGYKTGRPIRVELDPKSAVVLKIRNGQVSAEFVSLDKTLTFVVQQELDDLRNRMLARNLPVGTLEYKFQNPDENRNRKKSQDENNSNE